jgi:N-acetyl-gamma-glutamyl-phosphate reductase
MKKSIQTVVIGANGYVGGELLRLIGSHPNFKLVAAVSNSCNGQPISKTFGHLSQVFPGNNFVSRDEWMKNIEDGSDVALFSAAPHGASAQVLAAAIEIAKKKKFNLHIVDSSADFRFSDKSTWERIYGGSHGAPELLNNFSCAVPEHLENISTDHVGHPGCFATACLLAIVPLVRSQLIESDIFISGITGSSGSGRNPQVGTHHPERNSNVYAYNPLLHRHSPEIETLASMASEQKPKIHFVPHSGPFARGIHATIQTKTIKSIDKKQLFGIYLDAYKNSPFIEIVDKTPKLKNVVASNMCHIGVANNENSIVIMSVIDNLVKGAAGGSMQWMNRLWNLPETAGLTASAPGWI